MKTALIYNASVSISMSVLWILTMVNTSGRANINIYGEGWLEAGVFAVIGLYGVYSMLKKDV